VVLSHAFWTRRFGAAPDVIGRALSLNGHPFTIIGVAGQEFTGAIHPLVGEFWVPLTTDAVLRPALDSAARLDTISFHLIGRLKPGIDRARAQADLDTIGRQHRRERGDPDNRQAVTVYGSRVLVPEFSSPVTAFVAVLMTLVAVVLLIVCVNVANLVLARAASRRVEWAIRQSLGAGRGRLVRQLLTENLLLALAGASGGVLLAFWCARLVSAIRLPTPVPIVVDLSIDVRVLAFTAVLTLGATLAFGMVPALTASQIDLGGALKDARSSGSHRVRSAFLVVQVSLSVVLLIAAGLFVRSFRHLQASDPGFEASGLVTATFDLETRGYPEGRGREFIRALARRLEAAPGVADVNLVDIVPLTLSSSTTFLLRDADALPAPGETPSTRPIHTNAVTPGHFRTLRIATIAGRDFTELDDEAAPRVAIVNETLARMFWPGRAPLGQRLRPLRARTSGEAIEVIGVVQDSKYATVGEEPRPFMYRPLGQAYVPRLTVLIRSAGSQVSASSLVAREVRALDPALALFNVQTLSEAMSVSLLPTQIAGGLLGALGLLVLALAALGVYGVLSFLVRSRTREIGFRVAMGATRPAVVTLMTRQAVTWTVVGIAIGSGAAALATRFLRAFLYGISPTDPLTFGGVALLKAAVALVAALVPAVRASRLDPITALREL
jgi:predicted permease